MQIDVFNGDADGICALLQLRLAEPCESKLVTSFKRDIKLLTKVDAKAGDKLTVLDISLQKNHQDLIRILEQGAEVVYVDQHLAGDIPPHPKLTTLIDTDANTCTSLLVNQHLKGQFCQWAVVAAFGDNMTDSAIQAADCLFLNDPKVELLKTLGICINYNGYGSCLEDLHFEPDALYRELLPYESPFDFIDDNAAIYQQLVAGYEDDMAKALAIKADYLNDTVGVYMLPDIIWARRVSGVFGNELANRQPNRAHAIASYNNHGGYQISVRAPLNNKMGADELCASFPSGGGRKGAAGINHLEKEDMSRFIQLFEEKYR
ncbi:MAG: DHH family phosphoesterase [Methylococcaceae bacterium]|nr:DHH family phosphoesterase [Methylococcaceae bacterium]